MYKLAKDECNHLLDIAVTASYKKVTKGIDDSINEDSKMYAKRADILCRIDGTSNYFVTLKDNKENISMSSTLQLDAIPFESIMD